MYPDSNNLLYVLAALDRELEHLNSYVEFLKRENSRLTEENNHLKKVLSKAVDAEGEEKRSDGEV